jgi:hypothetical protein
LLAPRRSQRDYLPVTQDNEVRTDRLGQIGIDWWATIVAGVIVVLAVFDVLPKIPW